MQEHGQRPLIRFSNGTLEKLGEGLPPLGAEPILVTLDPNQKNAREISHAGREFIYCLEGKVTCMSKILPKNPVFCTSFYPTTLM